MTDYEKLVARVKTLSDKVEQAKAELDAAMHDVRVQQRKLASGVEITQTGKTATLKYNGRVIKATQTHYGPFKVKEKNVTIHGEWHLRNLAIALATGNI